MNLFAIFGSDLQYSLGFISHEYIITELLNKMQNTLPDRCNYALY